MLLLENWKPSAIGYKQATTVRPLSTAPDDDGGRGKCGQQSIVDYWSRWASCLQRDVRLDLTEAASRGSVSFSWHILLHCVFLFPCYATAKFLVSERHWALWAWAPRRGAVYTASKKKSRYVNRNWAYLNRIWQPFFCRIPKKLLYALIRDTLSRYFSTAMLR